VKPKGGDWAAATPGGLPVSDNEFVVPHLKDGQEYEFRVKAVNEAGPGEPSASTGPVVAEKPKGQCVCVCFFTHRRFQFFLINL